MIYTPMKCQNPYGYPSDTNWKCSGMESLAVLHVTAWSLQQHGVVKKSKQIESGFKGPVD